jgi:hypothetical protein
MIRVSDLNKLKKANLIAKLDLYRMNQAHVTTLCWTWINEDREQKLCFY